MIEPPQLTRIRSGWSVRIRYGADLRGRFRMPEMTEAEARARARRLQRMGHALGEVGRHAEARLLLRRAASEADPKRFTKAEAVAAEVVASAGAALREPNPKTFRDVCELWWSGELHRMAPDRVSLGTDKTRSILRARLSVLCESVGDVPISRFTLDTAERALAALPRSLMRSTRRAYAQRLARVLRLASLPPLRLIESSPIPSGWAPKKGPRRAYTFLYPEEDRQLLCCSDVDIERRWVYAFLAREGLRVSEALALKWSDVDTERCVIRLDRNKSRRPRTWRIGQPVAYALHRKRQRDGGADGDRVFHCDLDQNAAAKFRADLRRAGLKRPELFERSTERSPIRVHDLRGSFVTLSLATGKTETWVMDRTGHTTSGELQQYRRPARFAEEIGLGWYDPMDRLLPGPGHKRDNVPKQSQKGRGMGVAQERLHAEHKPQLRQNSHDRARKPQAQKGSGPAQIATPGQALVASASREAELAAARDAAVAAGEFARANAIMAQLAELRRAREGSR